MTEAERPARRPRGSPGHGGPQAAGDGAPGAGGGGMWRDEKGPSLVCSEGGAARRRCWTGCGCQRDQGQASPQKCPSA